jgi:hypothetical protein
MVQNPRDVYVPGREFDIDRSGSATVHTVLQHTRVVPVGTYLVHLVRIYRLCIDGTFPGVRLNYDLFDLRFKTTTTTVVVGRKQRLRLTRSNHAKLS